MRRIVHRGPGETTPRMNPSGGQNVIRLGAVSSDVHAITAYDPAMRVGPAPWIGTRMMEPCPAWGCGEPPTRIIYENWPGTTNLVPQPPPFFGPVGSPVVSAPSGPISSSPGTTVAVPTAQTAPSLTDPGTTLDSSGNSSNISASGIMAWFGESTLISGVPNWGIAAAATAVLFLMRGKGRR